MAFLSCSTCKVAGNPGGSGRAQRKKSTEGMENFRECTLPLQNDSTTLVCPWRRGNGNQAAVRVQVDRREDAGQEAPERDHAGLAASSAATYLCAACWWWTCPTACDFVLLLLLDSL